MPKQQREVRFQDTARVEVFTRPASSYRAPAANYLGLSWAFVSNTLPVHRMAAAHAIAQCIPERPLLLPYQLPLVMQNNCALPAFGRL